MQKIFYLTLFIFIFQIKSKIISLEENKIDVIIKNISLPQTSCAPSLGTFLFNINCEFSESPLIDRTITITLYSNIKALCYPLESTIVSGSFLQCEINLVDNPISNQNLFLPLEPPESNYYTFNNWKETIGSQPDTSNKISEKEINCLPKALNSFIINEYKNEGCSNGNNYITIKGKWNNENLLIGKKFSFNFDKINGQCLYFDINRIQCEIKGNGEIYFENDFYFKYGINVYKIDKTDIKIMVIDCNNYYNYSLWISNRLTILAIFMLLLLL